jgi:hypothetical protein
MSFIESLINITVGFGISLGAQIVFLPMLGVHINFSQNFIFAVIMTVISIARQFMLRRLFEALHIRTPLSPAMLAVIAERRRQMEVEGWDTKHDDEHEPGELALAGAAYLVSGAGSPIKGRKLWPWDHEFWKPDIIRRRRDFVRGLALGLAELEKYDRTKRKQRAQ